MTELLTLHKHDCSDIKGLLQSYIYLFRFCKLKIITIFSTHIKRPFSVVNHNTFNVHFITKLSNKYN